MIIPAEINNPTKIFEFFTAAKMHIAVVCSIKFVKIKAVYSF
jgi:hypothetical protein